MDTQTIPEMRARVDAHRAWLDDERAGTQLDIRADPEHPAAARAAADALLGAIEAGDQPSLLRVARLSGLTLTGVNLSGALLSYSTLTDLDLTGARLDDADLVGAQLTRVRLNGASAARAHLGERWTDCEAEGARCADAVLVKAQMLRTSATGVVFDRADLSRAEFVDCDLSHASFVGAALSRARFDGCDLRGADFTGADLSRARFRQSLLSGVRGEPGRADGLRVRAYETSAPDAEPAPGADGGVEASVAEFFDGLRAGRWR